MTRSTSAYSARATIHHSRLPSAERTTVITVSASIAFQPVRLRYEIKVEQLEPRAKQTFERADDQHDDKTQRAITNDDGDGRTDDGLAPIQEQAGEQQQRDNNVRLVHRGNVAACVKRATAEALPSDVSAMKS